MQGAVVMKILLVAILLIGWTGLSVQQGTGSSATSSSNDTADANSTQSPAANSSSNTTNATPATATPTNDTTNKPGTTVDVTARPVSSECQRKYQTCKQTQTSTNESSYCNIFNKSMTCINTTGSSADGSCNPVEIFALDLLECGPARLFNYTSVRPPCHDRISECLSATDAAKSINTTDTFKGIFCKVISDGACLTMTKVKSTCTLAEKQAVLKYAACSSPPALFSSILYISLAFTLGKLLKGY